MWLGIKTKQLDNNKYPGAGGLTTNSHQFFWPDIEKVSI